MPVTVRLSKLFYDRLGEEIADELVNWFNQVDATYRAELRELNELNFARFDAKVEQRLGVLQAQLEARFDRLETRFGTLERRVDGLETRIDGLETRMDALEARMDGVEHRMGRIESRMDGLEARLGSLEAKVESLSSGLGKQFAEQHALLERRLGEQTRWMFLAWATLLLPIIGLWIRG